MAADLTAPDPHAQLRTLLEALLEETLAPEQVASFEDLVRATRESRRLYLSYMLMHRCLPRYVGTQAEMLSSGDLSSAMILPAIRVIEPDSDRDEQSSAASTVHPAPAEPDTQRKESPGVISTWWRMHTARLAVAAAVFLASAILILTLRYSGVFGRPSAAPIAMGKTLDAVWADPGSVPAEGSLVKPGVAQSLQSGYAELTSANGLAVIIQGPATFAIQKAGVVFLTSGKLTASVPKPARGFTVNTPVVSIVDLGTEFGVSVSATGETDVQTFRGTVSLSSTVSAAASPVDSITAGNARHIGSSGDITQVPADTVAFVRPQQFDDWNANGTPYQRWKAYSERLRKDPDLVAYYTFDKSEAAPERLLNRVSTTGAALDGELLGIDRSHEHPAWTDGRWPQKGALAFGRDSHEFVAMKAPAGSVLDFSRGEKTAAPFTICAWFRVEDPHPQHSSLFLRGIEGKARSQQFAAEIYPDASVRASVGDLVAAGPQARANGQWQQIAFVYDPDHGALQLYLDGNLVAQRNDAPRQLPESSLPLGLGCRMGPDHLPPLGGRIDEFAVFRRVLSAEQVKEMYLAEKPD